MTHCPQPRSSARITLHHSGFDFQCADPRCSRRHGRLSPQTRPLEHRSHLSRAKPGRRASGPTGPARAPSSRRSWGWCRWRAARCRFWAEPVAEQRRRIGYVPQRESVDWDFPVNVLDVVLMGTYGKLGWFRRPGRAAAPLGAAMPGPCWARRVGAAANRTALRRSATTHVPGPGPGPGQPILPYGRADGGRRRRHRAHDFRAAARPPQPRQDRHRRASRPAHRHAILRTARDAQRRLVAAGPTHGMFTHDNIRRTYGGRLSVLDAAAEAVRAGSARREPARFLVCPTTRAIVLEGTSLSAAGRRNRHVCGFATVGPFRATLWPMRGCRVLPGLFGGQEPACGHVVGRS